MGDTVIFSNPRVSTMVEGREVWLGVISMTVVQGKEYRLSRFLVQKFVSLPLPDTITLRRSQPPGRWWRGWVAAALLLSKLLLRRTLQTGRDARVGGSQGVH